MTRGRAAVSPRRAAVSRGVLAVMAALALFMVAQRFEEDSRPAAPFPEPIGSNPPVRISIDAWVAEPVDPVLDQAQAILAAEAPASGIKEEVETISPVMEEQAAETGAGEETGTSAPLMLPVPSKSVPSRSTGGYWVQLGVFNATDNAEKLYENAKRLNMPVQIQARVMVGPFRNKAEAEKARSRLKGVAKGIVVTPRGKGHRGNRRSRPSKRGGKFS